MKKFYILATLFITSFGGLRAQDQITNGFETFNLNPDSFDNGSAGLGDFYEFETVFDNNYDTTFFSWSGFAISNMTDILTPGWGNQYSAYTGGGYNSTNYAVYYPYLGESIHFNSWVSAPQSMRITNTTYAALSMRDGDGYGKKFGDSLNADGVLDGTNGEDYLKVWIIGTVDGINTTDSVEFYLADYRFADDSLDYIVDTWVEVDLTPLMDAQHIHFRFESSDTNEYGIRTPTYFAMDDLKYDTYGGLEEMNLELNAYPNPVSNTLNVISDEGLIEISDMSGKVVYSMITSGNCSVDFSAFNYGIYMLKLSNSKGTTVRKLIK